MLFKYSHRFQVNYLLFWCDLLIDLGYELWFANPAGYMYDTSP